MLIMTTLRARLSWASIVLGAVFVVLLSAPTFATMGSEGTAPAVQTLTTTTTSQQGRVLPPIFQPQGISLTQMAKKTAFFNTGNREGTPPQTPFQILYTSASNTTNTFNVQHGKILYVPVIFNDNSEPVIGGAENFPASQNRRAVLNYLFGRKLLGVQYAEIVIDGVIYSLASDYVVQVDVPKLADGAGNRYQTIAGFISPLAKGTHTVEIRARAVGEALSEPPFDQFFPGGVFEFSTIYTVNVH
jgi:hypothetical protein